MDILLADLPGDKDQPFYLEHMAKIGQYVVCDIRGIYGLSDLVARDLGIHGHKRIFLFFSQYKLKCHSHFSQFSSPQKRACCEIGGNWKMVC